VGNGKEDIVYGGGVPERVTVDAGIRQGNHKLANRCRAGGAL
jgi:hypothetical protein